MITYELVVDDGDQEIVTEYNSIGEARAAFLKARRACFSGAVWRIEDGERTVRDFWFDGE